MTSSCSSHANIILVVKLVSYVIDALINKLVRLRVYSILSFFLQVSCSTRVSTLTAGMRLCHPPDGSTSPKYKLLCFKPPYFILPNTERTSF
jgi:hypothetical protein